MKKCKFCTADLQDDEVKCSYCGKSQDEEIVVETSPVKSDDNNQKNTSSKRTIDFENVPVKKNNIIFIILIVSIVLSMGACFLPYIKIGDFTMNYVYNENIVSLSKISGIKDGIFILIFGIVSILTMVIGKHKIPPVVCQALSIGVFLIDYIDAKDNPAMTIISEYYGEYYGIGFYLVIVFLLISLILSLIRLLGKDKYD